MSKKVKSKKSSFTLKSLCLSTTVNKKLSVLGLQAIISQICLHFVPALLPTQLSIGLDSLRTSLYFKRNVSREIQNWFLTFPKCEILLRGWSFKQPSVLPFLILFFFIHKPAFGNICVAFQWKWHWCEQLENFTWKTVAKFYKESFFFFTNCVALALKFCPVSWICLMPFKMSNTRCTFITFHLACFWNVQIARSLSQHLKFIRNDVNGKSGPRLETGLRSLLMPL